MKPSNRLFFVINKCRKALRLTSWRRPFVLLFMMAALGSFVVLSSVSLAKRIGGSATDVNQRDQPPASSLRSGLSQDESGPSGATRVNVPSVKPKVFHGDVRRLPLRKPKIKKPRREPKDPGPELPSTQGPDTALQQVAPAAAAPAPSASFPGLDFANWGSGWPPDTNGDVGPNHYIQTVNSSIGIFDKATGGLLAAFTFDTFFSQQPTGTPCDNSNEGDP
ncbi:MAG TPA: hypothetical protein VL866_15115, partial [Pyrinomonadaceae bacterium]|nr:hypothetical protein [Pyrinomonadaceae bacterium]